MLCLNALGTANNLHYLHRSSHPQSTAQHAHIVHASLHVLQGFDTVLSDMLHFTSGVNDVELSLELAGTAMNVATGHYFDLYGEAYEQQVGFRHTGFLKPGGTLVMKVYEVR